MRIEDAKFVIVDLETTGTDPAHERIIELAAIRIRGDSVEDTFETLIDPERTISKVITRITGITSADVAQAPQAYQVLPDFVEFLGDEVFVAHNCSFDWNFITSELHRAELAELTNSKLCTVRLARRLLPGLPSRSLGSLIKFYNIQTNSRHRALSDVLATHEVWKHLIDRLDKQHKITELDQLLRFQNSRYEKKSIQKNLQQIEDCLTEMPNDSGIYKMFSKDGRLLYIGKSRALKNRVRSYFVGIEGHAKHIRKMIRQVHNIKVTVTPTELEASLLESQLIKEFAPPFNKAGRRYRKRPFIRLGGIGSSPWVTVIEHICFDGAKYFGPISSRKEAIQLARALVDLFGDDSDSFRPFQRDGVGLTSSKIGGRLTSEGLQMAVALLEGSDAGPLTSLKEGIEKAAQDQAYEQAAQKHNYLLALESLQSRPCFLRTPLLERTGTVVYHGETSTEIHFMVCGVPISHFKRTSDQKHIKEAKAKFYEYANTPFHRVSAQQVDAISILGAWMFKEKDRISVLPYRNGESRTEFNAMLDGLLNLDVKSKIK